MGKFIINGGRKLSGEVQINGAKNAVLPLYAASILISDEVTFTNVPQLTDVDNMGQILESLGATVHKNGNTVTVKADNITCHKIPGVLAKELRSSIFLLGAILGRQRSAVVPYPGGCDIGLRPIDIHIKALRDMNVIIEEHAGYLVCNAENMKSGELILDYPSVGATENVILAAVLTEGTTTLYNAACEPEIVDLQNFLNKAGGRVSGAGTSRITVEGVKKLSGLEYKVMPDRIVAGSLILSAIITGGEIILNGANPDDIRALLSKLENSACKITLESDKIYIKANDLRKSAEYISTRPHPGFPTDLQAPMMALQTVCNGSCLFVENVFENRYRHVAELRKMGADILVNGRAAFIKGIQRLHGANVHAQDLRGGASLVLAGLNAEGMTTVNDINHIDRGYENFEIMLNNLGADVKRC